MKRTTLILSLLFAAAGTYAGVTVSKVGGGTNGYETVTERHVDGEHWLNCYDPGYSSCCWSVQPCDVIATQNGNFSISIDITPYVESQIAQNVHQGVYWLDQTISVAWWGTSTEDYTIHVNN